MELLTSGIRRTAGARARLPFMLPALSGARLNCADLGKLLHISPPTALAYIRELEATGLVHRLPFYQGAGRAKLVAWEDPSPRATLLERLAALRQDCRFYWWKCGKTREVGLIADLGQERVGFCFSSAERPRRREWLPLVLALRANVIDRAFLLHSGRRAFRTEPPVCGPVLCVPLDLFLKQLPQWMFEWNAPRQIWDVMVRVNREASARVDKGPGPAPNRPQRKSREPMAVPVFRPTVKRKDMGSVLSCIVSDRLGPGEISRDLLSRVCHLLGHAGGISLATSYLAVSAALESLGLAAPDAVILPALAPAAWLRVLRDRGLTPLVADVDADTGSMDASKVAALAARGAKALMVHHSAGIIVDVEALKAHGLPLIEDASQALGGKNGETPCGSAADICLLSLDPENIITCGGGALVLGRSRPAAAALKRLQEGSPLYAPLADMNAALGISQLGALESFVQVRREVAAAYSQALMKSRHKALVQKNDAEPVLFSFPVVLASGMKDVRTYALKKNVDTVPAFAGSIAALELPPGDQPSAMPSEPAPDGAPASPAAGCVNARSLVLRCLLFPLYPTLGKRDVEAVCKVLGTMP